MTRNRNLFGPSRLQFLVTTGQQFLVTTAVVTRNCSRSGLNGLQFLVTTAVVTRKLMHIIQSCCTSYKAPTHYRKPIQSPRTLYSPTHDATLLHNVQSSYKLPRMIQSSRILCNTPTNYTKLRILCKAPTHHTPAHYTQLLPQIMQSLSLCV